MIVVSTLLVGAVYIICIFLHGEVIKILGFFLQSLPHSVLVMHFDIKLFVLGVYQAVYIYILTHICTLH